MVYVSTEPHDTSAGRYNLVTSMKGLTNPKKITSILGEDEVDVMDVV